MQKFGNSINQSSESHLLLVNDNQLDDTIKLCEKLEQVNINNNRKMMIMTVL